MFPKLFQAANNYLISWHVSSLEHFFAWSLGSSKTKTKTISKKCLAKLCRNQQIFTECMDLQLLLSAAQLKEGYVPVLLEIR